MAVNISDAEWNKLQEAVGILAGWRPLKGDKPGKAVTQRDLQVVQDAVAKLQKVLTGDVADMTSTDVTAAPTAAQFNALRADVTAIHTLLSGIISSTSK
jgi:hypothetical protein